MKEQPGYLIGNGKSTKDRPYKYLIMQMTNDGYFFLTINAFNTKQKFYEFFRHYEDYHV